MNKRVLWVQAWEIMPHANKKATIDAIINRAEGKFTDILLAALWLTGGQNPTGACLGHSAFYHEVPDRINGLTLVEYFVEQAAGAGIQVHLWHVVGLFGAHRGLRDEYALPPEWNMANNGDPPCNAHSWVDLTIDDCRGRIIDAIIDMQTRNNVRGCHLDFIRYHKDADGCRRATTDQITDIVESISLSVPVTQEMSCAILGEAPSAYGGSKSSNTYQDVAGWLEAGLVNFVCRMRYHDDPSAVAKADVESYPNNHLILPGVSAEPAIYDDPDTAAAFIRQVEEWKGLGYEKLAYFDSGRLDDLPQAAWDVIPDVGTEPPPETTITLPAGDYNSLVLARDRAYQQVKALGEELERWQRRVEEMKLQMEGDK